MAAQHIVLGEINPAVSGEITAMKELDSRRDGDEATLHLKIFRETQGIGDLAEGLETYFGYGSSLASRAVARLSSSFTAQVANIGLVQFYDPEKHRAFYKAQVINLVGVEARLSNLDALEAMVNLLNTQIQAPMAPSMDTPRLVLLLGEEKIFKRRTLVCKRKQNGIGNIEMMTMEED